MADPAVFLDRDRTLTEDPGYLADPDAVRLLPGVGQALCKLRQAGFRLVVVSNQSAIARGLLDEQSLEQIHDRLRTVLAEQGAYLDAIYYCPYLDGPEATVEAYRRDSDLRKPRPGMLLQAARDLELDLKASWAVGDSDKDVAAGRAAGCRTILLASDPNPAARSDAEFVAADLSAAAEVILSESPSRSGALAQADRPTGQTDKLLRQVVDELRQQRRLRSQPDFTLTMLFGLIAQLGALLAAAMAVLSLLAVDPAAGGRAVIQLFFALWLQVLALTMFVWHRRREGG